MSSKSARLTDIQTDVTNFVNLPPLDDIPVVSLAEAVAVS
jgi:hypothetical protein